ncbi:MAG TPA: hypothetical protein VN457_01025 [Chlamydiales bacterium]|nr:hypothetical protein [Chlamydiales bacterium]
MPSLLDKIFDYTSDQMFDTPKGGYILDKKRRHRYDDSDESDLGIESAAIFISDLYNLYLIGRTLYEASPIGAVAGAVTTCAGLYLPTTLKRHERPLLNSISIARGAIHTIAIAAFYTGATSLTTGAAAFLVGCRAVKWLQDRWEKPNPK